MKNWYVRYIETDARDGQALCVVFFGPYETRTEAEIICADRGEPYQRYNDHGNQISEWVDNADEPTTFYKVVEGLPVKSPLKHHDEYGNPPNE